MALKTAPLSNHGVLFGLLWNPRYRSILQAESYATESRHHIMYTIDLICYCYHLHVL